MVIDERRPDGPPVLSQDHASQNQTGTKSALAAAWGALVTVVLGSACCWLPLLLVAFGFSAAGVGQFFEQYRPYLLTAALALLGLA